MAQRPRKRKEVESVLLLMEEVICNHRRNLLFLLNLAQVVNQLEDHDDHGHELRTQATYDRISRIPEQVRHMDRLVGLTDRDCIANLRMNRNTFGRLCRILKERSGLIDGRFVTVEEQVAMYLSLLSHHKKNRIVGFDFLRSGQTVSRYVHEVMRGIMNLHDLLMVKPTPVDEGCTDPRWSWFKGCLGALDGTYINVRVSVADAPRYRTRKGHIATNTLAVCDRFLRFVFVLTGWEGSAGDSRVLRDAVTREDGLKVPKGNYYLCDNGYANSEGFLTPFKGVRYHLKEWGTANQKPQNREEIFNMRHTMARNVIERAFAVLKMRWGILRSSSFYPIETQGRLIMTCFILHNFIRGEMPDDPVEMELDEENFDFNATADESEEVQYVDAVESTTAWNQTRVELAQYMWNNAQP